MYIYFIYVKICLYMQIYVYIFIKISVFCVCKHKNINKWIKSFSWIHSIISSYLYFPQLIKKKKKKIPSSYILVQGNPRSLSLLVAHPPSWPKTLEPHECHMWIVHVCVGWFVCMYVCVRVNRCWETIST